MSFSETRHLSQFFVTVVPSQMHYTCLDPGMTQQYDKEVEKQVQVITSLRDEDKPLIV